MAKIVGESAELPDSLGRAVLLAFEHTSGRCVYKTRRLLVMVAFKH